MKQVTVSLIVPVYNGERWLDGCMKSIFNQSFSDFEVIVINDGSTDGSLDILKKWEKREKRLLLISTENRGVSAARNLGISQAGGKYIRFLDCDDTMPSAALTKLVKAAELSDTELVIAPFYEVTGTVFTPRTLIENETLLTRDEYLSRMKRYPRSFFYSVLWNKLYRRDVMIQKNIRFDEKLSWSEDFLFNVHYLSGVRHVACLEEPVYDYHHHSSGLTLRFSRTVIFHPFKTIPLFRRLLAEYTANCLNGKGELKDYLAFFKQTHGI